MPDPPSINIGEKAYWTLKQTLSWIAWGDPDRGWPAEFGEELRQLVLACERGAVRSSRRIGKNGPRRPIEPFEWCDVELSRFPVPLHIGEDEWRFYYRNTPDRDFVAGTAEPWRDVLFTAADLLKAFSVSSAKPFSFEDLEAAYRGLSGRVRNIGEADKLVQGKDYFNQSILEETREQARKAAAFVGIMGRPRKK